MMQSLYTNVTRVRMHANVRRSRLLPYAGEVLVPTGQEVNPAHVVAKAPDASSIQVLRASDVLNVSSDKLESYLLVSEGAVLKRGTPLMRKPGMFGRAKVYRSPVNGYVRQIRDGYIVLEQSDAIIELRAMMPGKVTSIIPGRGVVLETTGSLIQALWDSGKDGFGKIRNAAASADQELLPEMVGSDAHGAILVAGRVEQLATLNSMEEIGARGLIVGSLPYRLSRKTSEFSFPVIATEGIGNQAMTQPILELLQQLQGRRASLLAGTSGPRRQSAEIIISLQVVSHVDQSVGDQDILAVGTQVRVFRLNNRSYLGRVKRIYTQPRKTELGELVQGADVEFDNGDQLFVPVSNLDAII